MRKKKIRGKKYDEEEKLTHPGLHSSYTKEQATMIQPQRPPLLQILLITIHYLTVFQSYIYTTNILLVNLVLLFL